MDLKSFSPQENISDLNFTKIFDGKIKQFLYLLVKFLVIGLNSKELELKINDNFSNEASTSFLPKNILKETKIPKLKNNETEKVGLVDSLTDNFLEKSSLNMDSENQLSNIYPKNFLTDDNQLYINSFEEVNSMEELMKEYGKSFSKNNFEGNKQTNNESFNERQEKFKSTMSHCIKSKFSKLIEFNDNIVIDAFTENFDMDYQVETLIKNLRTSSVSVIFLYKR